MINIPMKFKTLERFIADIMVSWMKSNHKEALVYFTTGDLPQAIDFHTYFESFIEEYADYPDEFDDSVFGSI